MRFTPIDKAAGRDHGPRARQPPFLAAATFAQAADLTPQEKALVEGAKKEGAVTVLNAIFSDRTGERLGQAFTKLYDLGPNFKFNNLRKGTGQTVAQVRQEIVAKKFTVDILLVSGPGFFDEAAKRDAFEKLDSGHWKNHAELIKSAGQYANYPYVVVPFAYSFQPVWNSSCPGMANFNASNYGDVVKPELKGKTIASDLTKSLTYTNTVMSLQENGVLDPKSYWDKLKATDPLVEFRTEPKMQMVITCQRPFDMWNLSGRVYQNVLKQPDLAKVLKIGHLQGRPGDARQSGRRDQGRAESERRQVVHGVHAEQGGHRHLRRRRVDVQLHEGLYSRRPKPRPICSTCKRPSCSA